jgi:uncharacterized protein (TIGR03083 family)
MPERTHTESPGAEPWIAAVRHSHDRLSRVVSNHSGGDDLRAQSACSEWSVAQVLSHLGSQGEIFMLFFEAGLTGTDPPGGETFQKIWDAWNAKSPEDQAKDSLTTNEVLVSFVEGLGETDVERFRLDMFGRQLDLPGLLRMRLSEHAVHTWDVEVAFDDTAAVAQEAVDLLVDGLGETAGRAGKAPQETLDVVISTTDPERTFELHAAEQVSLTETSGATDHSPLVELPAEAFVRLVYGRLDGTHPARGAVRTQAVDLSRLTSIFKGV